MSAFHGYAAETDHAPEIAFVDSYDGDIHCNDATLSVMGEFDLVSKQPMLHSIFIFDLGVMLHGSVAPFVECEANLSELRMQDTRGSPRVSFI